MDLPKYRRIILKLSGEALAGDKGFGIDPETVRNIALQTKEVVDLNVQVAVVVGGATSGAAWKPATGDGPGDRRLYGMLATVDERPGFAGLFEDLRDGNQGAKRH